MIRGRVVSWGIAPLGLCAVALALRWWFFSGFTLCDDVEELALIQQMAVQGPDFHGHLQYRVPMWWFNAVALRLFGLSEASFFLPTVAFSSMMPAIGYFVLRRAGYPVAAAFAAGLVVATAPFEILIGGLRANDLILAWFVALAVLAFVALRRWPAWCGALVAVLLWLGFWTKLWVIYLLPALGAWYAWEALRHRRWREGVAFTLTTAVLQGATALFWKSRLGVYVPFLRETSATYPVPSVDLPALFWHYPQQLFVGSEFGTTLFGVIPWLACALLLAKLVATVARGRLRAAFGLDCVDLVLAATWVSFLLLLELVPNAFSVDRYYSAPRIFRYLTPASFPIALHVAKMLLDLGRVLPRWVPRVAIAALVAVNVAQAAEATRPGRTARAAILGVADTLRRECPPRILVDSWLADPLSKVFLRGSCAQGAVVPIHNVYQAREYEAWLARRPGQFPPGTMLVSGIGSCVHYGCQTCGFRLRHFDGALDPSWTRVAEFGALTYLPNPEPVALWRLSAQVPSPRDARVPPPVDDPEAALRRAMAAFDAGDNLGARDGFTAIIEQRPNTSAAEDARYFRAVTFWREGDRPGTIEEMGALLARHPGGRWSAAAHHHLAMAYRDVGDVEQARSHCERILRDHATNTVIVRYARQILAGLPGNTPGERLRARWRSWIGGADAGDTPGP